MKNLLKSKKFWIITGSSAFVVLVLAGVAVFFFLFHLKAEKEYLASSQKSYKDINTDREKHYTKFSKYKEITALENAELTKTVVTLTATDLDKKIKSYPSDPIILSTLNKISIETLKKPTKMVEGLDTKLKDIDVQIKDNGEKHAEVRDALLSYNYVKCDEGYSVPAKTIIASMGGDKRAEVLNSGMQNFYKTLRQKTYKNEKLNELREEFIKICQETTDKRIEWMREVIVFKNDDPKRADYEKKYLPQLREIQKKTAVKTDSILDSMSKDTDEKLTTLSNDYKSIFNDLVKKTGSKLETL